MHRICRMATALGHGQTYRWPTSISVPPSARVPTSRWWTRRFVVDYRIDSNEAFDTALHVAGPLACAAMAMDHLVRKHLGPLVPADMKGARSYTARTRPGAGRLGNIDVQIMADFSDTWLAAEWGHPSDNLGAILAVADYLGKAGLKAAGP
jgi:2-methylcitrate dehydratase PrpD